MEAMLLVEKKNNNNTAYISMDNDPKAIYYLKVNTSKGGGVRKLILQ